MIYFFRRRRLGKILIHSLWQRKASSVRACLDYYNFTILGLILQSVSGQSYENYVQEHIFDPLEMRHSFTSQDEAIKDGMAMGHVKWFGTNLPKTISFNRGNLPNGFQICSVEDIVHYLIVQLNDRRLFFRIREPGAVKFY